MSHTSHHTCILLFLALLPLACSDHHDDDAPSGTAPTAVVAADVMLAAQTESTTTRLGSDVVQAGNADFRGLTDLRILPFTIGDTDERIEATHQQRQLAATTSMIDASRSEGTIYYLKGCLFNIGVNAVLCYAHAPISATMTEAEAAQKYGVLDTIFPAERTPQNIRFKLQSITDNGMNYEVEAKRVTDYLDGIVNARAEGSTTSWKNTTNTALASLFNSFVRRQPGGSYAILPGAGASVLAYAQAAKAELAGLDLSSDSEAEALRTAIITAIENPSSNYPTDYPASMHLPDGAAAVKWNGTSGFLLQTATTVLDNLNALSRFAYPAALWYYANSRLCTSLVSNREDRYPFTSGTSWPAVLNTFYENHDAAVTQGTLAVAVKDPLQYGVACLAVTLRQTPTTLPDAQGTEITVGTQKFPVTGIIVGQQRPVGYDFRPLDNSDLLTRFVYDSQVTTPQQYLSATANATTPMRTLLLQSYDGEAVNLALQLRNNSGVDFLGADGWVRQGTQFYLLGRITPEAVAATAPDYQQRVFTQDYTTTVQVSITSLEKAYNVLPDLLTARLEVGIQLTPQWTQSTTSYVILQ